MKRMKIGDIARELNIKKSQLRQWESEFSLQTRGQSSYTIDDMKVFVHIKKLMKTQGLSRDQIKTKLEAFKPVTSTHMDSSHTTINTAGEEAKEVKTSIEPVEAKPLIDDDFRKQLIELKLGLIKLRDQLL